MFGVGWLLMASYHTPSPRLFYSPVSDQFHDSISCYGLSGDERDACRLVELSLKELEIEHAVNESAVVMVFAGTEKDGALIWPLDRKSKTIPASAYGQPGNTKAQTRITELSQRAVLLYAEKRYEGYKTLAWNFALLAAVPLGLLVLGAALRWALRGFAVR